MVDVQPRTNGNTRINSNCANLSWTSILRHLHHHQHQGKKSLRHYHLRFRHSTIISPSTTLSPSLSNPSTHLTVHQSQRTPIDFLGNELRVESFKQNTRFIQGMTRFMPIHVLSSLLTIDWLVVEDSDKLRSWSNSRRQTTN